PLIWLFCFLRLGCVSAKTKCTYLRVGFFSMAYNVFVYGKLRVCGRGFSEGKSEASKRATNFVLAKTSNFLYTELATGIIPVFLLIFGSVLLLLNFVQLFLHFRQLKNYQEFH